MPCTGLRQTCSAHAVQANKLACAQASLPCAPVTPGPRHARRAQSAVRGGCASAKQTHASLQRPTREPGRLVAARAAVDASNGAALAVPDSAEPLARLVAVVADGKLSAIGNTDVTLAEVLAHMARRVAFSNPAFQLKVFTDTALEVRAPGGVTLPRVAITSTLRPHRSMTAAQ